MSCFASGGLVAQKKRKELCEDENVGSSLSSPQLLVSSVLCCL